jgi:ADP-ribosylation factor protein 6
VIDSSDKVRIDEARQELHRIINDREMKESLLLVFANKQDIPGGTPQNPLSWNFEERTGADEL